MRLRHGNISVNLRLCLTARHNFNIRLTPFHFMILLPGAPSNKSSLRDVPNFMRPSRNTDKMQESGSVVKRRQSKASRKISSSLKATLNERLHQVSSALPPKYFF